MTTSKLQLINCQHCHQKTSQTVIFHVQGKSEIVEFHPGDDREVETYLFLAQCKNCSEFSLYSDWGESADLGDLNEAFLLYPSSKKYDGSVPLVIIENYTEAKRVFRISPIAFAVLIRRCLEYICKDQHAVGKNLVNQLNDLVKKEIIPPTLSKMTTALRFFGNVGAHATDTKVGFEDARIIDDFFTTILEYVYVAPSKLKAVQAVIDSKKKNDV
ncbi:MAG: hypothetical protein JWO50_840 [Candidatus Kaiserbacteria bacterium]|nr:hypothetical protein [Candidatus Kaiserbacteria bacterium]